MKLEDLQNLPATRTFNDNLKRWGAIILIAALVIIILFLMMSNVLLSKRMTTIQTENIEAIKEFENFKQEIKAIHEQELVSLREENIKANEALMHLLDTMGVKVKDLTNVIQITTKSNQKFEREINGLKGKLQNAETLINSLDSLLQTKGDTLDLGFLQEFLDSLNVNCDPTGFYVFEDTTGNLKWKLELDFDSSPDKATLYPRYESELTLLTTAKRSGFLHLGRPIYEAKIASNDAFATYRIKGGTFIPPKEILSVGFGAGYGITYNNNNFFFSPNISVGVYKKIFTLYHK